MSINILIRVVSKNLINVLFLLVLQQKALDLSNRAWREEVLVDERRSDSLRWRHNVVLSRLASSIRTVMSQTHASIGQ